MSGSGETLIPYHNTSSSTPHQNEASFTQTFPSSPLTLPPGTSSLPPSPFPISELSYLTTSPSLPITASLPPTLASSLHPSPPPPSTATTAMAVDLPIILLTVPLALGVILGIMVFLICFLIIFHQLRRRKRLRARSQSFKQRNSENRRDQPNSLEVYTGGSPTAKSTLRGETEESAEKYELQTRDTTTSILSVESPTQAPAHASNYLTKTLPPNGSSRLAAAHSDTQRSSLPRDHRMPVGHSASVETFNPHAAAGNAAAAAAKTSSLQRRGDPRLQGIPEHSTQSATDEKYVVMIRNTMPQTRSASEKIEHRKRSLDTTDTTDSPVGIREGLDPTSLYDVPSSALAKGQGSLSHISENPHGLPDISEDPLSVYDIPKSALIAAGHYKVPPIDLGVCHDFDVYDVPPSASALYDVPPSASALYDVPPSASALYDVPPSASALYDVPPSASALYDVPPSASALYDVPPSASAAYDVPPLDSGLYDVPPSALSKLRKYSQPTSQQELIEAHQYVMESAGPDDVFSTYDVPQRLTTSAEQSVPDYSHYDVPKNLMLAYQAEESQSPTHATKQLSRRNSSPTHAKRSSIYDVPRNALLADSNTNISGPPTAPKPSKHPPRKESMSSRSRSASSPIEVASPAHKPHPNEAFYDVLPLDPDVIAQRESKPVTSHKPATSHLTSKGKRGQVSPTHSKMQSPKRTQSVPAKGKKKVPPPTRTKPGKKEAVPPPTRTKPGKKEAREHK